jgi:iron complex outermembrane receptor protein
MRIIILLMLSLPCHATESIIDEIVVTAAKHAQPVREVPSAISIIDEKQLGTIDHAHINEVLHRVSGVWISRGNGQEHLTAIRSPVLTGAGSCGAFLMLQDGVSLRAPGFCNVNELFEASTELASRIEVLKGPGSDIYGSNAMHGAVNVLTPSPVMGIRRLRIEAGKDEYYRARLSLSTDTLRADFSVTTHGGFQTQSGFDQQKLLIKHQFQTYARDIITSVSFTNLNQETAGFIVGHQLYKDATAKKVNPTPEAYRDARSFRLLSEVRQPLGNGELLTRPYLRNVKMTFLQHFLPGQAIEENGHSSAGLQAVWTSKNWNVGFEAEYTSGYLQETQPNTTTGSPFLVATIPQGKHYDYNVNASLVGAFIQYQHQLAAELSIIAAARFQFTHYDYDNQMLDGRTRDDGTPCTFGGCRFNRPSDRKDTFSNWSPKLGFVHSANENFQFYGSLARGFRAPQATELYRLQNNQDISDIDSVELDSIEFGIRGNTSRLDYNISFFDMNKRNFIFRDTARQNVDGGETTHRGAELNLSFSFNDRVTTSLAMTWARHEYANNPALSVFPLNDNEIDTAPSTIGSATIDWKLNKQFSLELEWVHVGEYFQDCENQHEYEGHDLLHLRGHWQLKDAIRLSARIMNLLDEAYAERADFAFGSDRYFVGTPISFFVGLNLEI